MTFSDPSDGGFKADRNTHSQSPLITRMVALGEPLAALRGVSGAQLVEFAFALPLLLVLLVGIMDFATAFDLRQKLTNAAREGARIGASQPTSDLTLTNPPSVQGIRDAVANSLQNANVNTSFIGSSMNRTGPYRWTYYSSGTYGLEIERVFQVPVSTGGWMAGTRITVRYPYKWTFGFDRMIRLLVPGASYAGTVPLTGNGVMPNISGV